MPELPEVETTRKKLLPLLRGKTLLKLLHQDPSRYRNTEGAEGERVLDLERRGKFLLFALTGGKEMVVHLGMTGGFRREKTPHARVEFVLEDGRLFFHDPRRFGRIWVVERGAYGEIPLLARLGPEPLGAFPFPPFYQGLKGSRKPLKALLLEQRLAAGVGNIYADEALFHLRGRGPFPRGAKPLAPRGKPLGGGGLPPPPGSEERPGRGGGPRGEHPFRQDLPAAGRRPRELPDPARGLRAKGPPLPPLRRPHPPPPRGRAEHPLLPPVPGVDWGACAPTSPWGAT